LMNVVTRCASLRVGTIVASYEWTVVFVMEEEEEESSEKYL
jgi:hypothetical protein